MCGDGFNLVPILNNPQHLQEALGPLPSQVLARREQGNATAHALPGQRDRLNRSASDCDGTATVADTGSAAAVARGQWLLLCWWWYWWWWCCCCSPGCMAVVKTAAAAAAAVVVAVAVAALPAADKGRGQGREAEARRPGAPPHSASGRTRAVLGSGARDLRSQPA